MRAFPIVLLAVAGAALLPAAKNLEISFIDHGESVEHDQRAKELYNAYVEYRAKGNHILAKPGVTIPVKGLDVKVLTADGDEIENPLPGAGQANPLCAED